MFPPPALGSSTRKAGSPSRSYKPAWRDLPAGSFSEVGTNVNTVILRVNKNGKAPGYWY